MRSGSAVVRATALIPSPVPVVWAAARGGMREIPGYGPVRVVAEDRPGGRGAAGPERSRVVAVGARWGLVWTRWVVPTGAGVSVTDELRWSSGPAAAVLDPVRRHRLLRALTGRTAALRAAVAAGGGTSTRGGGTSTCDGGTSTRGGGMSTRDGDMSARDGDTSTVDGMVVVGAALLDGDGRVLAAQRAEPPALAGQWEFPGGKVEPGETELAALRRECAEELGVRVELGDRLGPDLPIQGGNGVLRVWTGWIAAGELEAREHAALRWLAAGELDDVSWLPADRPLVERLKLLLTEG